MNFKKIALIIGFILTVIGLSYLMYIFFFRSTPPPPPLVPPITEVPPEGLPPVAERVPPEVIPPEEIVPEIIPPEEIIFPEVIPLEKVVPPEKAVLAPSEIATGGLTKVESLTDFRTYGTTLSSDGKNALFYNRLEGKFYRVTPDGKTSLLTDKVFHNVKKINWTPNKEKAILEYPDDSKIIYDFKTKKQVSLPKHWEEFDFAPLSNEFVFKSMSPYNPEDNWLSISNADGSGAKAIEPMGENADKVTISYSPNNQVIAFSKTGEPLGYDREEIYLIGKYDENFKSLEVEGRGFEPLWSPEGKRILYSVHSTRTTHKPELWIVEGQGDDIGKDRKDLKIETWAHKCTFAGEDIIYCAVPEELPEAAGWFPTLAKDIPDNIYKINLKTGSKSLIAKPSESKNANELIVTDDQKYLFFTDRTTDQLYKIRLR